MSMQEADNTSRFHHQWLPDDVLFEPNSFSNATLENLKSKGNKINEKEPAILGKMDAVLVLPDGNLEGGVDYRGDDKVVGF